MHIRQLAQLDYGTLARCSVSTAQRPGLQRWWRPLPPPTPTSSNARRACWRTHDRNWLQYEVSTNPTSAFTTRRAPGRLLPSWPWQANYVLSQPNSLPRLSMCSPALPAAMQPHNFASRHGCKYVREAKTHTLRTMVLIEHAGSELALKQPRRFSTSPALGPSRPCFLRPRRDVPTSQISPP